MSVQGNYGNYGNYYMPNIYTIKEPLFRNLNLKIHDHGLATEFIQRFGWLTLEQGDTLNRIFGCLDEQQACCFAGTLLKLLNNQRGCLIAEREDVVNLITVFSSLSDDRVFSNFATFFANLLIENVEMWSPIFNCFFKKYHCEGIAKNIDLITTLFSLDESDHTYFPHTLAKLSFNSLSAMITVLSCLSKEEALFFVHGSAKLSQGEFITLMKNFSVWMDFLIDKTDGKDPFIKIIRTLYHLTKTKAYIFFNIFANLSQDQFGSLMIQFLCFSNENCRNFLSILTKSSMVEAKIFIAFFLFLPTDLGSTFFLIFNEKISVKDKVFKFFADFEQQKLCNFISDLKQHPANESTQWILLYFSMYQQDPQNEKPSISVDTIDLACKMVMHYNYSPFKLSKVLEVEENTIRKGAFDKKKNLVKESL